MIIGLPLYTSLQKKRPILFSNDPTTGGSIRPPMLLAVQYKLQSLVCGLYNRMVLPSQGFPSNVAQPISKLAVPARPFESSTIVSNSSQSLQPVNLDLS